MLRGWSTAALAATISAMTRQRLCAFLLLWRHAAQTAAQSEAARGEMDAALAEAASEREAAEAMLRQAAETAAERYRVESEASIRAEAALAQEAAAKEARRAGRREYVRVSRLVRRGAAYRLCTCRRGFVKKTCSSLSERPREYLYRTV